MPPPLLLLLLPPALLLLLLLLLLGLPAMEEEEVAAAVWPLAEAPEALAGADGSPPSTTPATFCGIWTTWMMEHSEASR
jgi:hypothetical protein